jgi:FkbM family methyltransferase
MLIGNRPKQYLDIGANNPFSLSNTALFYKKGGAGILVEPDPELARQLRSKRPRDKMLQVGVHCSGERTADFFVMDSPTLNTFSSDEMRRYVSMGHKLKSTIQVDLMNINTILEVAGQVDFMNIDIEGLDHAVLAMVDWDVHRPTCVCVETLTYEVCDEPVKRNEIIQLMEERDYILFADTFINTIFVDRRSWQSHWNTS